MRRADQTLPSVSGEQKEGLRLSLPVFLASVTIIAIGCKIALLVTDSVAFTSDEAVMALMGKHIARGELPIFYYGEAYVGSLDAILIAAAFKAIGQSVLAVRLVQTLLYLSTMLATYLFARRVYGETAARFTAVLMSIPPVLLSLHTTAGLGAYGETLLFGTCLLLVGHYVLTDRDTSWLLWGLLGFVAGLGFWTFGLILVYLLPVGLLALCRFRWRLWARYLVCGAAFFAGSAPWWWYNLANNWAALKVFYDPQAGTAIAQLSLLERAIGFLGLGLPALIGLRPSWSTEWVSLPLSPLVVVFYLAVAVYTVRRWRRRRDAGTTLLLLSVTTLAVLLIATRFGADTSGRYVLPLYSAVFPLCGMLLARLRQHNKLWASVALVLVLGFHLIGNAKAIFSESGLTTEFWSDVRFDYRSDEQLIEFLLDHDLHYGYSNRHTHFRIDFLSDEQVLLLPRLSSRSGLCINLDGRGDRYPPYTQRVEDSPVVFYVTTDQPYLDALLRLRFAELEVTHREEVIRPYRVFYGLSRRVSPRDLCSAEDGL